VLLAVAEIVFEVIALGFQDIEAFVLDLPGHQGKNTGSNDPENFGRVSMIYIDPKTNEGFVYRSVSKSSPVAVSF
jgi:hypothetical protein